MNIFYTGWVIFVQDFHLRYRRATLGAFWFFIPALIGATAVILSLFPFFHKIDAPSTFGTLAILINVLIFQSFTDGISIPVQMLRRTRLLVRNTPVNPSAILIASFYMGTTTLLTRLPLFFAAEYFISKEIGMGWFFVIPFTLGLLLIGMILGAFLSPLSIVMLDVRFGLPFMQGFFLLITPVLYSINGNSHLLKLEAWNPLAFLLINGQNQITGLVKFPLSLPSAIMLMGAFVLFWRSVLFFNRSVKKIADIL